MNPHYPEVSHRAANRCEYCHAPEAIFNFAFEVEHIVPTLRGGADVLGNLALACRSCNIHKASRLTVFDETSEAEVRLFNPRDDRWADHFRLDIESGAIIGTTDIGRVTTGCLHMNSQNQLTARAQWLRLGLFL